MVARRGVDGGDSDRKIKKEGGINDSGVAEKACIRGMNGPMNGRADKVKGEKDFNLPIFCFSCFYYLSFFMLFSL